MSRHFKIRILFGFLAIISMRFRSLSAADMPPTVATVSKANPANVTSKSTALSVLGADDGGEANLIYTWSVTGPAPLPTFSANGTHAAKSTRATFATSGNYIFTATMIDLSGQSASSSVPVAVTPTLTSVLLTPASVSVNINASAQFTAVTRDQFAANIASPSPIVFSVTGGGTIDSTGNFTAGSVGGSFVVSASVSGKTDTSPITVNTPPTIATAAAADSNPVTGTSANLSVLGADDAGESHLNYTWSATGPATVSFSPNGNNASKLCKATFKQSGDYVLSATLKDAGGLTTTSTTNLSVQQTPTTVTTMPSTVTLDPGQALQFSAKASDQFKTLIPNAVFTWTTTTGTVRPDGVLTPGTDAGGPFSVTASSGAASGSSTVIVNAAPTVVTAAAVDANPILGTFANVSALGADDAGESHLVYSWSATGPGTVSFSPNSSNVAKNSKATFRVPGEYTFTVTMTDAGGLKCSSSLNMTVAQNLTKMVVLPASAIGNPGQTIQFTVICYNQFNVSFNNSALTWATTSGTIDNAGLETIGTTTGGPYAVTVQSGNMMSSASLTVNAPPTLVPITLNVIGTGPTSAQLLTAGEDDGGEDNLKYTWSIVGTPPAPATFTPNGTNSAKVTTITWKKSGNYTVQVTAKDALGLTAVATINLIAYQIPSAVVMTPTSAVVKPSAKLQFKATLRDQYNQPMTPQTPIAWTVDGGGTIDANGLLTAMSASGGPYHVVATYNYVVNAKGDVDGLAAQASFIVDTPPTVSITSPAAGTTFNTPGNFTLSANAAHVNGTVAKVDFYQNNVLISTVNAAPFTLPITNLGVGNYSYVAKATDELGVVGTSATVSITCIASALAAPSNLSATWQPGPVVKLSWSDNSTSETNFVVARSSGATGPFTTIAQLPANTTTYTDSGIDFATYYYYVHAVNATGDSSSNLASTATATSPTIAQDAGAYTDSASGFCSLSVLGADVGGEAGLTYTWVPLGTLPEPVVFNNNGTNSSKNESFFVSTAGTYDFEVIIINALGGSVSTTVSFTIDQYYYSIAVLPAYASIHTGGSQQFTAQTLDQFGNPCSPQPAAFTWELDDGVDGTLSQTGFYQAGTTTADNFGIFVSYGEHYGYTLASVVNDAPTIVTAAQAGPNPTSDSTALNVLADDDTGEAKLTYTWTATTAPAPVAFSANVSNAAKVTQASFMKAGMYVLTVTIADPEGLTATSSVTVTVNQVPTAIDVTPESVSLNLNGVQQFFAVSSDQFGNPLVPQPKAYGWSVNGGGFVGATGIFEAGSVPGGPFTVQAADSNLVGTAAVSLQNLAPTIVDAASAVADPIPGTVTLNVLGGDGGGDLQLHGYSYRRAGSGGVEFNIDCDSAISAQGRADLGRPLGHCDRIEADVCLDGGCRDEEL